MKLLRTLAFVTIAAVAHTAFATSAVTDWNATFLQAVRDVKLGPPMVARAGAIVHSCIYDAWACYDANANGSVYGGSFRRPEAERTQANKEKAIAYAAYRALVDLFPARKADFDARMATLGFDINDTSTNLTTPSGIGNVVANAVITVRHFDGSNQLGDLHAGAYSDYTGYVATNPVIPADRDNSYHRPESLVALCNLPPATPGVFAMPGYLVPHWGNVKPFAMTSGSQFRPAWPCKKSERPLQEAGGAPHSHDGAPRRPPEGDRRILGRWPSVRDTPWTLESAGDSRFAKEQLRSRYGREALLCAEQCGVRQLHRSVGCQAVL
jgi:hypothetical protein